MSRALRSSCFIGFAFLFILLQPAAVLHGEESKRAPLRLTLPKDDATYYVLDKWFLADLHMEGEELVLVLNLRTYGKPERETIPLGLVFSDADTATAPFSDLVKALQRLKPRGQTVQQSDQR